LKFFLSLCVFRSLREGLNKLSLSLECSKWPCREWLLPTTYTIYIMGHFPSALFSKEINADFYETLENCLSQKVPTIIFDYYSFY
jgi:hypothetical protein